MILRNKIQQELEKQRLKFRQIKMKVDIDSFLKVTNNMVSIQQLYSNGLAQKQDVRHPKVKVGV